MCPYCSPHIFVPPNSSNKEEIALTATGDNRKSRVGLLLRCYKWLMVTVFKKPTSQQLSRVVTSRAASLEMTSQQLIAIQCTLDKIDIGGTTNAPHHENHHHLSIHQ